MVQPTEKEREAIKDFYRKVAPLLIEWRKRWDINSMPDPMHVFAASMAIVLQWWLEIHFPEKEDALAQLDFFEKVWREAIKRTPNWGSRL